MGDIIDIIGDILVRILIIIISSYIIFGITALNERVSNIETQLQILTEMEKDQ